VDWGDYADQSRTVTVRLLESEGHTAVDLWSQSSLLARTEAHAARVGEHQ
jgi:hypothetical protein